MLTQRDALEWRIVSYNYQIFCYHHRRFVKIVCLVKYSLLYLLLIVDMSNPKENNTIQLDLGTYIV